MGFPSCLPSLHPDIGSTLREEFRGPVISLTLAHQGSKMGRIVLVYHGTKLVLVSQTEESRVHNYDNSIDFRKASRQLKQIP